MNRRDVLKNMGLATGFFVATPSIISLLQSCTSDVKTWTPDFFSAEEGIILKKLTDIILPKTDGLPSATELNVPQFIDKYCNEVLENVNKAQIKSAFSRIIALLKPTPETILDTVPDNIYKELLDEYMLVKDEIDIDRLADLDSLELTNSEFLNNIKWMTISAYLTTEKIGETVLKYDPVPSQYYCGDLQEITGGVSWSLGNNYVM